MRRGAPRGYNWWGDTEDRAVEADFSPRRCGSNPGELTTVSDARQTRVMRLRESAESRRGVLRGGGAEQRLLRLLHGGGGHVCSWAGGGGQRQEARFEFVFTENVTADQDLNPGCMF